MVVGEGDVGTVYEGSDGDYYTEWQVDRRIAVDEWTPCLADLETGARLVGTAADELLMLAPVDRTALPPWLEIRTDGAYARVVDTRRTVP